MALNFFVPCSMSACPKLSSETGRCGLFQCGISFPQTLPLCTKGVDPRKPTNLAVVLDGPKGDRTAAVRDMAGIAFDVMLETGILVEALPLWKDEMDHPERFSNPALIANIQREGLTL